MTEEKSIHEVEEESGSHHTLWLPSGIISFAEFDAMEEANKQALQIKNDASLFKAIVENIMQLEPEEGQDKPQMIRQAADDFSNRIDNPTLKEEEKDINTLEGASIDDEGKWSFTQPFLDGFKNLLGINKDTEKPKEEKKANPGFSIWKAQDGEYHWMAAYSNNFRDDDNPPEIISAQSHKDFDEALEKGEWPMPELWLWHEEYPVGRTLYHTFDKETGFPVAGGVFNEGMEWAAEGVIKTEWDGVSHSMPKTEIRYDKEDSSIIVRHRTSEISLLPNWAAANKLAFNLISSKENSIMADKGLPDGKREEFATAFGEDRVTEIEQALSGKAEQAKAEGIESKESKVPEVETKEDEVVVTRKELFEALALVLDEVKSLKVELAEVKEEKKEEPQDLVSMLQQHSAIGKEETKVDGRTKEAKDVPQATDGEFHPIGIIDRIMKSNHGQAVR